MLRFTAISRFPKPSNSVDPYAVLGVTVATPFEEVRQCYHRLTREYHPDMPHGDPVKFRDIHTAYRQIRADFRKSRMTGKTPGPKSKRPDPQSGANFWEERNRRVREEFDRASERKVKEDQARTTTRSRGIFGELLYLFKGYEILLSFMTVGLVFICSVERYYTIRRMLREREEHLRKIDVELPPMMPMEVSEEMKKRYNNHPDHQSLVHDAERIREESSYRRATQRRFDDFREFMYVYDPEGIADRKVHTTRFSYQYMNEADIPKRCPIMREFNSDVKGKGYNSIAKELESTVRTTPWTSPDAAFAGALVTKGLGIIPANSPATAKWTFIEYTDKDKGGNKAVPTCLVALRNHRFENIGMCQRVTVTGKASLQPRLVEQREVDLKSGALKKRSLVSSGKLPVKDLSVPLQNMKL